jgi:hypothetical protein
LLMRVRVYGWHVRVNWVNWVNELGLAALEAELRAVDGMESEVAAELAASSGAGAAAQGGGDVSPPSPLGEQEESAKAVLLAVRGVVEETLVRPLNRPAPAI